jgi:RNA polymerase sigma factor (TIGR02999 family)
LFAVTGIAKMAGETPTRHGIFFGRGGGFLDPAAQRNATQLLSGARVGSESDLAQLIPLVYAELRQVAGGILRRERCDHTLQPTGLVHEAFIRLVDQTAIPWESDVHFKAIAARAMRQVLVDHARRRNSLKRGGDRVRLTLFEPEAATERNEIDVLALEDALVELGSFDKRKCSVVELLFFGGLTRPQAAEALRVSPKTIEADWYFARAWLSKKLSETPSVDP